MKEKTAFDNLPEKIVGKKKSPISTKIYLPDYYKSLGVGKNDYLGIQTGFSILDKATLGLRGVIVLGGVAGQGKTSLALQLAFGACEKGTPALFYSLEMQKKLIFTKVLSRLSGISNTKLDQVGKCYLDPDSTEKDLHDKKVDKGFLSKLEQERLEEAKKQIEKSADKFYVRSMESEQEDINPDIIEKEIILLQAVHETIKVFVVVDHLQILNLENDNSINLKDRVDRRMDKLKQICEKTGATIFILSQKNRAGRDQVGLHTLMGSAGIEHTADVVMVFHEKDEEDKKDYEKYRIFNEEDFDNGIYEMNKTSQPKNTDLIITKNRNGELLKIKLTFDGALSKFTPRKKVE